MFSAEVGFWVQGHLALFDSIQDQDGGVAGEDGPSVEPDKGSNCMLVLKHLKYQMFWWRKK